jgi:hypothetical protein
MILEHTRQLRSLSAITSSYASIHYIRTSILKHLVRSTGTTHRRITPATSPNAHTISPSSSLWAGRLITPYFSHPIHLSWLLIIYFRPQLLNLGMKQKYAESVGKLGFSLEDLLAQERDAALGNGGLGRLAACYLDSSASQVSPPFLYPLIVHVLTNDFAIKGTPAVGLRLEVQIRDIPTAYLARGKPARGTRSVARYAEPLGVAQASFHPPYI